MTGVHLVPDLGCCHALSNNSGNQVGVLYRLCGQKTSIEPIPGLHCCQTSSNNRHTPGLFSLLLKYRQKTGVHLIPDLGCCDETGVTTAETRLQLNSALDQHRANTWCPLLSHIEQQQPTSGLLSLLLIYLQKTGVHLIPDLGCCDETCNNSRNQVGVEYSFYAQNSALDQHRANTWCPLLSHIEQQQPMSGQCSLLPIYPEKTGAHLIPDLGCCHALSDNSAS